MSKTLPQAKQAVDTAPAVRRDPYLRWALLLALAAFAMRICAIAANLPDVPNPDEFKLIWPPLRMAYGTWYAGGGYPPLYMFILLAEYGAYYLLGSVTGHFAGTLDFARQVIADPTSLYLLGRTTSVLLGTATVLLLYAVGRRLYDGRVGLLAAAFLAFDTVHVYQSQVVKPDVLMTFLLIASYWFACGILQRGRTRDYVLAGLLAGLATAAKFNAALTVLPIVVAHLLRSRSLRTPALKILKHPERSSAFVRAAESKDTALPERSLRTLRLRAAALRSGCSALFSPAVAPRAAWTSVLRPLFAGPLWLAGLYTVAGFLLGYPHFLRDPMLAIEGLRANSTGFFWAWLGWEGTPLGWFYYPAIALSTAWGLPLQLLALAGLLAAFVRRQPRDLLLTVMPLANYLVMGSVRVNQPRYFLLAAPFLLLLAAKLLSDLIGRLPLGRLRPVALPMAALFLIGWPLAATLRQDAMLIQTDPRVQARQWVEAHVPAGSHVVLDTGGPALSAGSGSLVEDNSQEEGRFAILQRELAAQKPITYDVLSIRHYINGPDYTAGREATVHPLAWYRLNGYEYIILSDIVLNSYRRWPGVAARYPETLAFYAAVAQDAELLAEFRPQIPFLYDFTQTDLNPVPTVRIYRLRTVG